MKEGREGKGRKGNGRNEGREGGKEETDGRKEGVKRKNG